jgi:hypothetical protein
MLSFFSQMLGLVPFGLRMLNAFEGVAARPYSKRSGRIRLTAAVLLLSSAGFLLIAAILWRPLQRSLLSDFLGWTGVAFFVAFVFVGNRCYREQLLERPEND